MQGLPGTVGVPGTTGDPGSTGDRGASGANGPKGSRVSFLKILLIHFNSDLFFNWLCFPVTVTQLVCSFSRDVFRSLVKQL